MENFMWELTITSVLGTLAVFLASFFAARKWILYSKTTLPEPPGPRCLPIFGYLLQLKEDCHLKLTQLGKEYGSIYQIFLGSKRVVVISDPALLRHAFKQSVFSGRPDTGLTKLLEGYVSEFLSSLSETEGSPIYVRPILARAVSNVVGSMLMSVTFKDDEGFKRLLYLIEEGFKLLTVAVPVNFMPFLRYMPVVRYAYRKIESNKKETSAYFAEIAERHRRTLDPENVRDFVDAFFVEQQRAKSLDKETYFSGRRTCVGDSLTKMEVFLFLTSLLQQFELRVPEGENPPSLVGETHVSVTAKPFKICAVPREQELSS
ncbi:UNVERIFIED_CONTAM: Cyp18a1 [Trichonephila clavipes]